MVQTVPQLAFGILRGKQVIGSFNGGDISSDGGVLLLAEAERRTRIIAALAATIIDERDPARVRHSVEALLRQRIYAIACGYEDCNDFDRLRADPAFKPAVGRLHVRAAWLRRPAPRASRPPSPRGRRADPPAGASRSPPRACGCRDSGARGHRRAGWA